ncbi:MAG: hypothetical protein CK424_04305 [Legionella sp.]|nr:MAG: hypothetical protein CK424_04305 [Legionella sp.]
MTRYKVSPDQVRTPQSTGNSTSHGYKPEGNLEKLLASQAQVPKKQGKHLQRYFCFSKANKKSTSIMPASSEVNSTDTLASLS